MVEDEQYIRDLYRYTLEQAGLEIVTAADGASALEKINKMVADGQNPDLILLDIMLPKLNGIELLKELKKNSLTNFLPVVLITNLGAGDIIRQAFATGAVGYMMKARVTPYDILELVRKFISTPGYKMNLSDMDFD